MSEYAGNRIQDSDSHSDTQCRTRRRFVISVKKWMRIRLSVGNLCDKFENILVQLVHASGARPLVGNALGVK